MDLSLAYLSLSYKETKFLSLEGVEDVGGEEKFELSMVGRLKHIVPSNLISCRINCLICGDRGREYVFLNWTTKGISLSFFMWYI